MVLDAHDSMQEEKVEMLEYMQQERTDDVSKHEYHSIGETLIPGCQGLAVKLIFMMTEK